MSPSPNHLTKRPDDAKWASRVAEDSLSLVMKSILGSLSAIVFVKQKTDNPPNMKSDNRDVKSDK